MDTFEQLGAVFSGALTEVILTSTGVSLSVLSQENDYCFEQMLGVMSLNGKKSGMLFITAAESDIRALCSKMIGVTPAEVTNGDIEDTLAEFVNMTAGSAKLRLSDTDFAFMLSPPFVIKGENISIAVKRRTRVISAVLGDGSISVKLKVLY